MSKKSPELPPKKRVVIFGSYERGYSILSNLLKDHKLLEKIDIVGVATDDPDKRYTSAGKRVWQYTGLTEKEYMIGRIEKLASSHGIPVYKGMIKHDTFYNILEKKWKPDIVYMGTFGQILNERIISTPNMGIFNVHPANGETWPSNVGPNPFEQMLEKKQQYCALALHHVNTKQDDGDLAYFSQRIRIPYERLEQFDIGTKVKQLHMLTSPYAGPLVNTHLRTQLGLPLTRGQERAGYAEKIRMKQEDDERRTGMVLA